MKTAIPALLVLAIGALAGCQPPATSTSSTTVVKEPVVQKETKEVIVQVPAPAPAPEPAKPESETKRSSTTTKVETPYGTQTRTDTESTKTTK